MSDTLAEKPAPWSLTGSGYIVALKPARGVPVPFLDPTLASSCKGVASWLMFVDYAASDVGPYRELLYIPGSSDFGSQRSLTISRIFVSTEVSVVNGRRNWGIPKDRADFDVMYGESGTDRVRVSRNGQRFAEFVFRSSGPRLPFSTAFVPRAWRTLAQRYEGRDFVYTPSAKGRIRAGCLASAWTDRALFPEVSVERILLAVRAETFELEFPKATVSVSLPRATPSA